MRVEIICTGDEMLTGKIGNTNVRLHKPEAGDVGLSVAWETTVGDDRENLLRAPRLAGERADAVIVNRGLGPTVDDLSQEIAGQAAGCQPAAEPGVADPTVTRLYGSRQPRFGVAYGIQQRIRDGPPSWGASGPSASLGEVLNRLTVLARPSSTRCKRANQIPVLAALLPWHASCRRKRPPRRRGNGAIPSMRAARHNEKREVT